MKRNHDLRISVPVQLIDHGSPLSFSTYTNRFQKKTSLPGLSIWRKHLSSSQDTALLGIQLKSWCWAGWWFSQAIFSRLCGPVCHARHLTSPNQQGYDINMLPEVTGTAQVGSCFLLYKILAVLWGNEHLPGSTGRKEYLTFSCCNPFCSLSVTEFSSCLAQMKVIMTVTVM